MGRTVSPLMSFRTTIGMLVTGSIMSPRIFISTSIVALPSDLPFFAPYITISPNRLLGKLPVVTTGI